MANSDNAGIARSGAITFGRAGNPAPEHPRAAGLQQQQQHAKARHEKFLELFARAPCRKNLRVLRFKKVRAALGAGEFVDFQFFQPLIFLQPHLEPARKGDQRREAEEDRGRLPGQRADIRRDDKCGDKNKRRRDQVDQTVFLNIAFHVFLLNVL